MRKTDHFRLRRDCWLDDDALSFICGELVADDTTTDLSILMLGEPGMTGVASPGMWQRAQGQRDMLSSRCGTVWW